MESHPPGNEMLLHVTGIVRRCCVDLAVRVHARLFSPPRWVHRNRTYSAFVRHDRRWRPRCRMRDDDARNAPCCPKPRRRNKASGSTQQSSLIGKIDFESTRADRVIEVDFVPLLRSGTHYFLCDTDCVEPTCRFLL